MNEINSPNQTLKEIINEAIGPIHQRLDEIETNLNNRLDALELSHQDLKTELQNFLTELVALLNKKKPSDLQKVLTALIGALETASENMEELDGSIAQLQNTLDNTKDNNPH